MEDTPLTKEQLEFLGFTVHEKHLKSGTKVEVWHSGCYSDYIGTSYGYPSFRDIITNVVRNVIDEERYNLKEKMTKELVDKYFD